LAVRLGIQVGTEKPVEVRFGKARFHKKEMYLFTMAHEENMKLISLWLIEGVRVWRKIKNKSIKGKGCFSFLFFGSQKGTMDGRRLLSQRGQEADGERRFGSQAGNGCWWSQRG